MPIFMAVLKTGLNVILACNIPKNSPLLEVWFLSVWQIYFCGFSPCGIVWFWVLDYLLFGCVDDFKYCLYIFCLFGFRQM